VDIQSKFFGEQYTTAAGYINAAKKIQVSGYCYFYLNRPIFCSCSIQIDMGPSTVNLLLVKMSFSVSNQHNQSSNAIINQWK